MNEASRPEIGIDLAGDEEPAPPIRQSTIVLQRVLADLIHERLRQERVEGHSAIDDDFWSEGELALAAVAYILADPDSWPFEPSGFKPRDARSNLIRAAALLLAEIERLDREMSPEMRADIWREAELADADRRRQEAE